MIRLRQVALVAADLDPVVTQLSDTFGPSVCFRDPGVAEFGLHNALMVVGDQFLEVVSPTEPGTTCGRLLDKRHGGSLVSGSSPGLPSLGGREQQRPGWRPSRPRRKV